MACAQQFKMIFTFSVALNCSRIYTNDSYSASPHIEGLTLIMPPTSPARTETADINSPLQ
ncbi:unnamed protein product [Ceratitis capitata]|uniref:(Mediterranean fruit fly) hypothetical protein n=1 Tax=Ceratitis capitata TaxID=7213 RepID=A0A811U4W2_CERCA|nr:unnamed protein product [Ceratitis capitata]